MAAQARAIQASLPTEAKTSKRLLGASLMQLAFCKFGVVAGLLIKQAEPLLAYLKAELMTDFALAASLPLAGFGLSARALVLAT